MTTSEIEFLRQEYFYLQAVVDKFDEKALTIKAWSVTIGMAGIGAAFTQKAPILLLLSAFASLLFWAIEGLWKTFQQAHYPRVREIELLMRGDPVEGRTSPLILISFVQSWDSRMQYLVKVLFWPHVFLPHAIVFLGGVTAWVANVRLHFLGAA